MVREHTLTAMQLDLIETKQQVIFKTPQEFVHIRHRISHLQYKIWALLLKCYHDLYKKQGHGLADGQFFYLSMKELADQIGYTPKVKDLKDDLDAIRIEPLRYNLLSKDGREIAHGSGFISEWSVSVNRIGVVFPKVIRNTIERLEDNASIYHLLNWSVFNQFSGKYEAIIYKLAKDFVGVGKTPYFALEDYRNYMGLDKGQYEDFKRLNQWVISGPCKRINQSSDFSDIEVEPEFTKENRKVVGIRFVIKSKSNFEGVTDEAMDQIFAQAKFEIPVIQKRKYLKDHDPEIIKLSIDRANNYIEESEKAGKKINVGAIYRTAIKEDWGMESKLLLENKAKQEKDSEESLKDKESKERSQRRKQLEADFLRVKVSHAIKNLNSEERQRYISQFFSEVDQQSFSSYDATKHEFKDKVEKLKFNTWMRQKLSSSVINEDEFNAWIKNNQKF